MPRYRFLIEYDGKRFSGWQKQPNAPTIQEEIEKALKIILRQEISVTGSGRTDAGVHARGQVAHVDLPEIIDSDRLLKNFFGLLPQSISIKKIDKVGDDFHARFDATSREYRYYFSNKPLPLSSNCITYWWHSFDYKRMNEAASFLKGDIDCTSFTPFDEEQPHLRCIFFDAFFTKGDENFPDCFTIKANRFLRSLVRSLMGSLMQVGIGKMTVEEFKTLITNPDRTKAGPTAPPDGLVLHKVSYD